MTDVAPLEPGRVAVGTKTPPQVRIFTAPVTAAATPNTRTGAGEILVEDDAGRLGSCRSVARTTGLKRSGPCVALRNGAAFFNADGVLAASVLMAEGFEPYAARDGLVWGVLTVELDVESVRAYRLINP